MQLELSVESRVRRAGVGLLAGGVLALLSVGSTSAQNLLTNGDFGTGDLTGWSVASGEVAQTTIGYDGSEGLPAGSALLDRVTSTEFDNKDILYQIIDVEVGKQYKVDASWKGDLYNGGDGRNWAEAMVQFVDSGAAIPDGANFLDSWIQYKKASDGGPNEPSPTGFDWESILDSPDVGPADGVFTASDEWMVLGFNLGGRDVSSNNTQPGFYYVDNASVTQVPEPASVAILALACLGLLGGGRRLRR